MELEGGGDEFNSAGADFLGANATAGWRKAFWAAGAELLFRFATAGFYGSLTQPFRVAEPACTGVLAVWVMLPLISHSMELALHALRGTPQLKASIIWSVIFTFWSKGFNWFAMRRGALVVGRGQASLASDLARFRDCWWNSSRQSGEFPVE
jgi:hypothetical protein